MCGVLKEMGWWKVATIAGTRVRLEAPLRCFEVLVKGYTFELNGGCNHRGLSHRSLETLLSTLIVDRDMPGSMGAMEDNGSGTGVYGKWYIRVSLAFVFTDPEPRVEAEKLGQ
jgi:hypothetical protein